MAQSASAAAERVEGDASRRAAVVDAAFQEVHRANTDMAQMMAAKVEGQAEAVTRLSATITGSLAERPTTQQVKQLLKEAVGSPAAIRVRRKTVVSDLAMGSKPSSLKACVLGAFTQRGIL